MGSLFFASSSLSFLYELIISSNKLSTSYTESQSEGKTRREFIPISIYKRTKGLSQGYSIEVSQSKVLQYLCHEISLEISRRMLCRFKRRSLLVLRNWNLICSGSQVLGSVAQLCIVIFIFFSYLCCCLTTYLSWTAKKRTFVKNSYINSYFLFFSQMHDAKK